MPLRKNKYRQKYCVIISIVMVNKYKILIEEKMKKTIVLLLLLFTTNFADMQSEGTLKGKVVDIDTKQPLIGVNIIIARINRAMVGLLIAGITVCPSTPPRSR